MWNRELSEEDREEHLVQIQRLLVWLVPITRERVAIRRKMIVRFLRTFGNEGMVCKYLEMRNKGRKND